MMTTLSDFISVIPEVHGLFQFINESFLLGVFTKDDCVIFSLTDMTQIWEASIDFNRFLEHINFLGIKNITWKKYFSILHKALINNDLSIDINPSHIILSITYPFGDLLLISGSFKLFLNDNSIRLKSFIFQLLNIFINNQNNTKNTNNNNISELEYAKTRILNLENEILQLKDTINIMSEQNSKNDKTKVDYRRRKMKQRSNDSSYDIVNPSQTRVRPKRARIASW